MSSSAIPSGQEPQAAAASPLSERIKTGTSAKTGMEAIACITLFPILGPAFGFLSLVTMDALGNDSRIFLLAPEMWLAVFSFSYVLGFAPALFTGFFIAFESPRSLTRRYLLSALIGFLTSTVFPGILVILDSSFPPLWLMLAMIGAVSAVLCLSTVLLLSAVVRLFGRYWPRGAT